LDRATAY